MTPPSTAGESSRAVLTLALGPTLYLDLAINLARSFFQWNQAEAISFHIVTDRLIILPSDLAAVNLIVVQPGRFGSGFTPKLWLDHLVPAANNLFIDADCLCFGSLDPVFDRFAGRPVAMIGQTQTDGHFFGDIEALRKRFNLPWIISFVGCVYYVEKSEIATSVYTEARLLEAQYDQLGLVRLRGVPNDEPLMALAMAGHGLLPLADDGLIKADAMHYQSIRCLDVVRGVAWVEHPWPEKAVPPVARPVLFHFNAYFTESRFYRRESIRLELIQRQHWPVLLASAWALVRYDWPAQTEEKFKNLFRPLYRAIGGTRGIKAGQR